MKKLFSVVLIILFSVTVVHPAYIIADAEAPLEETTVTGLSSQINAEYGKTLRRTLTITPADGGRTVRLQLYLSDKDKYETVKTYKTADAKSAKLTVVFPKNRRKKTTGKWRIVVLKSKTAKRRIRRVTVTTKNIIKKKLTCKAACVYCADTKKVVYGLKVNEKRKQASTTKIMTSILLLESGKLGDTTEISKKAAETPYSHPVMKQGDIYTNKSMLYTMLLPSSNGSAVAVAEMLGKTESGFADLMNDKAKEIGMKNTHYVNPHGLDESGHYSSAYDLALQMAYIYPKSKNFRKAISSKTYTFTTQKYNLKYTVETTDMLKDYSNKHKGGKTGTTSGAGCCNVSVYVHEGKTYTVSILGAPDDGERWNNVKKLYSYIDEYAATQY